MVDQGIFRQFIMDLAAILNQCDQINSKRVTNGANPFLGIQNPYQETKTILYYLANYYLVNKDTCHRFCENRNYGVGEILLHIYPLLDPAMCYK